jgi:hypothetical protein
LHFVRIFGEQMCCKGIVFWSDAGKIVWLWNS